jgi:hypothetical protein
MWIDFRICFWKIIVLYEIYREFWKRPNTFVYYICLCRGYMILDWVESQRFYMKKRNQNKTQRYETGRNK